MFLILISSLFYAGLILGAVAKELFPLIDTDSKNDNLLGITIGFVIGLAFVNYLDLFVTYVEGLMSWVSKEEGAERSDSIDASQEMEAQRILERLSPQHLQYNSINPPTMQKSGTNSEMSDFEGTGEVDGDEPIMLLAQQAIASPVHRQRIRAKIAELVESISSIERKSHNLHGFLNQTLPSAEAEQYADQIDEEIHRFQYSLDNCRRCDLLAAYFLCIFSVHI